MRHQDEEKAKLRAGSFIYPVALTRLTDPARLDTSWKARLNKIGREPSQQTCLHGPEVANSVTRRLVVPPHRVHGELAKQKLAEINNYRWKTYCRRLFQTHIPAGPPIRKHTFRYQTLLECGRQEVVERARYQVLS